MKSGWQSRLIAFAFVSALAMELPLPQAVAQQGEVAAAQKRFQSLYAAGNYAAALAEAKKTEKAAKRGGTDNFAYISALNDLARANQALGQYSEAAAMFKQVLNTLKRHLPPTDASLAQPLANLASVYLLQRNNGEAEKLFKQALDITKKKLGPSNPTVAVLINDLGNVYKNQARYAEAEEYFNRALDMAEKTAGGDSLQVALILNNLTKVYEDQSRFGEVEAASKRALAIRERVLGPDHPEVAASLNNLAHVYERMGRYAEAEAIFLRVVEVWERTLGANHPHLATALLNLASVYADEERLDEAEALYKRALGIRKTVFGPDHSDVATVLNNLAQIYEVEGRYDDVETYAGQALAIVSKTLGPNHPDTAKVLRKLGVADDGRGRYAEAEAHFKRAIDIFTKAFGPEHRFLATVLINQGHLFEHEKRYDEADRAYKRALAINEKARGANHPDAARVLNDLALLHAARDPAGAVEYSRKATAAVLAHARLGNPGAQSGQLGGLIEQRAAFFATHVASLASAARAGVMPASAIGREAFQIAQWANQSAASAAVQQLMPRFGAHTDGLAALVRQHQDLSAFWRAQDKALVDALAKADGPSNASQIDDIRRLLADTERKLAATTAQLQKEFPNFAALANPSPLQVEAVQKLLGPSEALVFLLTGDTESYVFALTNDGFEWRTIPAGLQEIVAKVKAFRSGVDVNNLQMFDIDVAHELYLLLIKPVDALVKDRSNLLIVPSGVLTALPFHLLVTEKPARSAPGSKGPPTAEGGAAYRDAAWLIKRQAVSVLPSVGSLQVLRSHAHADQAPKPMIGYGDPVFDPNSKPGSEREQGTARSARSRGIVRAYSDYWRGAAIDRGQIAQSLPQLPDTADELKAIAQKLGVAAADIHLGRDATVTAVKLANLANFRIVYFATHGLVAGDIKGLAEPSLVLSLPAHPTRNDDGLLKASEVAQLKLNADWVVLSACNTIAGNKPGAEALSGLARAFFYAGARALLVSHWAVESEAATKLTTSAFAVIQADPTLGRAEAMRRSMMALLNDKSRLDNAYPAIWGPFAVIGEGSKR